MTRSPGSRHGFAFFCVILTRATAVDSPETRSNVAKWRRGQNLRKSPTGWFITGERGLNREKIQARPHRSDDRIGVGWRPRVIMLQRYSYRSPGGRLAGAVNLEAATPPRGELVLQQGQHSIDIKLPVFQMAPIENQCQSSPVPSGRRIGRLVMAPRLESPAGLNPHGRVQNPIAN
jgi:hypothetical protein